MLKFSSSFATRQCLTQPPLTLIGFILPTPTYATACVCAAHLVPEERDVSVTRHTKYNLENNALLEITALLGCLSTHYTQFAVGILVLSTHSCEYQP